MSNDQTIAISCPNCNTSIRCTLDDWAAGFSCADCGSLVKRPTSNEQAAPARMPTAQPSPTLGQPASPQRQEAQAIASDHLVPHLEQEIQRLLQRIHELEASSGESDSTRQRQMQTDLEVKRAENHELREAIKEMAMEQARTQHKLEMAEARAKEQREELEKGIATIHGLERDKMKVDRTIETLTEDLQEARAELETAQGEVKAQKTRADQLEFANRRRQEELETVNQQLAEANQATAKAEEKSRELASSHEEESGKLKAVIARQKTQIDDLTTAREEWAEAREELEHKANQAVIDLKLMKEKIDSLVKGKVEAARQAETARQEADELQKKQKALLTKIASQMRAEKAAAEEKETLAAKAEEAGAKLAELEQKQKALLGKIAAQMKAEKAYEAEKEELAKKLEAATATAEEATRAAKAATDKLATAEQTASEQQAKAEDLQAKVTAIREEQAKTLESLKAKHADALRELEDKLNEAAGKAADAEQEKQALASELEDAKGELQAMQAAREALEKEAADADHDGAADEALQKKLAAAQAEGRILREKLKNAGEQLKEQAVKAAKANKGVDVLKQERDALQAKLDEATRQFADLQATVERDPDEDPKGIKKKLAQLSVENRFLKDKLEKAGTEGESGSADSDLQAKYEALQQDMKSKQQKAATELHKLNTMNKLLREKLQKGGTLPAAAANEELDALKIENEILREQVDNLAKAVKDRDNGPQPTIKKKPSSPTIKKRRR